MLIILIILFATIFFAQGLIRLCFLVFRPRPSAEQQRRNMLPRMYGPGGYAIPRQPIRVVLARDEEAAGIESETTKMKPPAYGLWRESVVSSNQLRVNMISVDLGTDGSCFFVSSASTPIVFTGSATHKHPSRSSRSATVRKQAQRQELFRMGGRCRLRAARRALPQRRAVGRAHRRMHLRMA